MVWVGAPLLGEWTGQSGCSFAITRSLVFNILEKEKAMNSEKI